MQIGIILGIILISLGAVYLLYMSFKGRRNSMKRESSNISPPSLSEIYLAGGCFWGVQKYFDYLDGVVHTAVGYANGNSEQPTYDEVCNGTANFAETVHIQYDPAKLSLPFLLAMYYKVIDPTALNKQGNDYGVQYRTGIYYINESDRVIIETSLRELQQLYEQPLAIEIAKLKNFSLAEGEHQDYLSRNPNGYCHIHKDKFVLAQQSKDDNSYKTTKEYIVEKVPQNILKTRLTPEQYAVTQENETEKPFQNEYWDCYKEGIYVDVTTGEPLFISKNKYDSGCGWPSFTKPISNESLIEKNDNALGMKRVEVRSKIGDAHLGHVFNDGPISDGGHRYCINSASLRFIPKMEMKDQGYEEYIYLLY